MELFLLGLSAVASGVSLIRLISLASKSRKLWPGLVSLLGYFGFYVISRKYSPVLFCYLYPECSGWDYVAGAHLVILGIILFSGTACVNVLLLLIFLGASFRMKTAAIGMMMLVVGGLSMLYWETSWIRRNLHSCHSVIERNIDACNLVLKSWRANRMEVASAYEGRAHQYKLLPIPDYESATQDLLSALEILRERKSDDAFGILRELSGIELVSGRRYEVALGYLDQAIEIQPHNRIIRAERSYIYIRMGKFDLALEDIDAAAAPKKPSRRHLVLRAVVLAKTGEREAALIAIDNDSVLEFLKENPVWAYFEVSQVSRLVGESDAAYDDFLSFVVALSEGSATPSGQSYNVYEEHVAVLKRMLGVPELFSDDGYFIPEVNDVVKRCFVDDECYEKLMSAMAEVRGDYAEFRYFGL